MAPDDRKTKCTTRLGALDVPRSSVHKAEEFVGFRLDFMSQEYTSNVPDGRNAPLLAARELNIDQSH